MTNEKTNPMPYRAADAAALLAAGAEVHDVGHRSQIPPENVSHWFG